MRFEVKRTGWVDWNFGASGDGLEVLIVPVLLLANLLVWLAHRARGRGYTLHAYGGPGRGHTRERFRTRAEAEAASAALQESTAPIPADTAGLPRRKRPQAGGDRVEGPAPAPGDMDGPFRRGPSQRRSSRVARGDR